MKRLVLYVGIVYCILSFAGKAAALSPVETSHFRVVANGAGLQASDLKKVSDQGEGIYNQVTDMLGVGYTSSGKIEIRVYVTPKGGRALAPAASESSICVTFGRIDEGILKQGIALIIVKKSLGSAPLWFKQGLIQYIAYGDMRQHNEHLPAFKDFTFAKLEHAFQPSKMTHDAYRYSYAIVSYLMETYGKDKIKDIFKQHGSFSDKFSKTFGVDLRSLEKKADEIFAAYK